MKKYIFISFLSAIAFSIAFLLVLKGILPKQIAPVLLNTFQVISMCFTLMFLLPIMVKLAIEYIKIKKNKTNETLFLSEYKKGKKVLFTGFVFLCTVGICLILTKTVFI